MRFVFASAVRIATWPAGCLRGAMYGPDVVDPPLIAAVKAGYTDAVRRSLEEGVKVNVTGDIKAVRTILARQGVNVDEQGPHYGRTALMWAALLNQVEIGKLLIDAGAKPSVEDRWGTTTGTYVYVNSDALFEYLSDKYPGLKKFIPGSAEAPAAPQPVSAT